MSYNVKPQVEISGIWGKDKVHDTLEVAMSYKKMHPIKTPWYGLFIIGMEMHTHQKEADLIIDLANNEIDAGVKNEKALREDILRIIHNLWNGELKSARVGIWKFTSNELNPESVYSGSVDNTVHFGQG
jgi:hypothetical protein